MAGRAPPHTRSHRCCEHNTRNEVTQLEQIRKHIVFTGYVQGVGFRYRAYYSAQRLGITGWVRNRSDGAVEMEAEGSPEAIADLIEALGQHRWGQIDEIRSERIPLCNDRSFEIR